MIFASIMSVCKLPSGTPNHDKLTRNTHKKNCPDHKICSLLSEIWKCKALWWLHFNSWVTETPVHYLKSASGFLLHVMMLGNWSPEKNFNIYMSSFFSLSDLPVVTVIQTCDLFNWYETVVNSSKPLYSGHACRQAIRTKRYILKFPQLKGFTYYHIFVSNQFFSETKKCKVYSHSCQKDLITSTKL